MSAKKMRSCKNSPKNSYTEKKVRYKPSGYAWCSICSFDDTKKQTVFIEERIVLKKVLPNLKELETEIINFGEKEMIPLTNKDDTINK